MNILQINKFYHIVGGVDRYYLELGRQLEKRGHDLAYFSMLDKRNKKTEWSKYFVSNASFDKPYMFKSLKLFFRMVYFQEARRKISRLLDNFTPDVAHVHHIYHQISPSILFELKKRKIVGLHPGMSKNFKINTYGLKQEQIEYVANAFKDIAKEKGIKVEE